VEDARRIVARFQTALPQAVAFASVPPFTSSYGLVGPQRASDLDGALRLADTALYQAKGSGRDRCCVHGEEAALLTLAAPEKTEHRAGDGKVASHMMEGGESSSDAMETRLRVGSAQLQ